MKNAVKPVRYNFYNELHHAIKLAAVGQNKTMETLVINALEEKFLPLKKTT